jgi:hypothetical protein
LAALGLTFGALPGDSEQGVIPNLRTEAHQNRELGAGYGGRCNPIGVPGGGICSPDAECNGNSGRIYKLSCLFCSRGHDVLWETSINLGTGVGKLGFSMMDANGTMKDTHHLLMDISDKFKGMPDGIEKNALAMKLFGKSGTDMIPFLNKGSEGIADLEKEASKFGLVVGQDSVDAMTKNKLAHRQMHAAWEGLQVMIGEKLMPIVSKFTSWMAENLPSALAWASP